MKEYIEKETVLNAMLYEMVGTGYQDRAMSVIKFAPAADVVEVKHGSWIHPLHDYKLWTSGTYGRCSRCGYINEHTKRMPNFCENCGAKMDGETRVKLS